MAPLERVANRDGTKNFQNITHRSDLQKTSTKMDDPVIVKQGWLLKRGSPSPYHTPSHLSPFRRTRNTAFHPTPYTHTLSLSLTPLRTTPRLVVNTPRSVVCVSVLGGEGGGRRPISCPRLRRSLAHAISWACLGGTRPGSESNNTWRGQSSQSNPRAGRVKASPSLVPPRPFPRVS